MSLRSGFESTHKHICFSSPKIAFYQAVFPSTSPESTRFLPSHTFSCKEITSDKRMSPRFHILSPSCKRLPGELNGMGRSMSHTIPRALAVWRQLRLDDNDLWGCGLCSCSMMLFLGNLQNHHVVSCQPYLVGLKRWRILASSPPTTMSLYTPEARQTKHHRAKKKQCWGWYIGCLL